MEKYTATNNERILKGIIEGMSDGVIILGLDGRVHYTNPAATSILDMDEADLAEHKMVSVFYEYAENDLFVQTILDAIYDPQKEHFAAAFPSRSSTALCIP
jgi:PAS domain-containing protein